MSDNNELISIIVPIYNVQKYLDRCMNFYKKMNVLSYVKNMPKLIRELRLYIRKMVA